MIKKGYIGISKLGISFKGLVINDVDTIDDLKAWLLNEVASTFDQCKSDIRIFNCSGTSPLIKESEDE